MMRTSFKTPLLVVTCSLAAGHPPVFASPLKQTESAEASEGRKSSFSIGILGQRHSLKATDSNELIGNSAAVQLGSGYIAKSWYLLGSVDILLGPYEPVRNKQLNVDFVGTGISLWTGVSAQNQDLRSPEGSYGFALGLSYSDTIGRSIGRNRKDTADASTRQAASSSTALIDNYVMRVSNLSLMPAMFFSWLQPARPRGNTPELLKTRLEGYLLTIGVALPLQVTYQAHYELQSTADLPPAANQGGAGGGPQNEKGTLSGYSLQIALTALLGT